MLEATVDEVAGKGIDVHLIQLAHGQVPWYQSKVYPMEEHLRWWRDYFGADPLSDPFLTGGISRFILEGGDPLQIFIDRCRATGQAPFISLRLNDVHHVENIHTPGNTRGVNAISRFYAEHLDCRFGSDLTDWFQRTLDWSRPEVPAYMFSLIEEQCENYDIDGFELDFMRFPHFFETARTPLPERVAVMTGFVRRVREVLDRTAGRGRHRWLCARVPCYLEALPVLGLDLSGMAEAGLEMINLSASYFTVQQTDLARIREMVPEVALYHEICHSIWNGRMLREGYDAFTFRRATPEQYFTTAHHAYARGADGMSAFNFVYYREHGVEGRGPFNEPPFEVFEHLGDPDWLAKQRQHYFLASGWLDAFRKHHPMPCKFGTGEGVHFSLDLAPPDGAWKEGGRLRIQAEDELGESTWKALLNGVRLEETPDRSEPYPNPYTPLLGGEGDHRAWRVSPVLLRDGENLITITLENGRDAELVYLDLGLS